MSLFESVWVKLVCERCGKVHETHVRFRSYAGAPDAEYKLLEVAPAEDGLPLGEAREGNADRYCRECYFDWSIKQAYAAYESLKELIEKGLVTVRAKGQSTPLPASAIDEYAEEYTSELIEDKLLVVTMPYFEELDLTVGDNPYDPDDFPSIESDAFWMEFLLLIDPLISERMSKDGWVADDNTSENFRVSLDDERRVVVEDMQGKRLTRDGARHVIGRSGL